jgi:hypothetical protein
MQTVEKLQGQCPGCAGNVLPNPAISPPESDSFRHLIPAEVATPDRSEATLVFSSFS